MSQVTILVIEDDPDARANFCDILELDGYSVETAGSFAEVRALGRREDLAVIVLDRKLPDGTADDLYPELRELAPDAAIIVVTAYAELDGVIAAFRNETADYLPKPVDGDLLRARVARIIEQNEARRQLREAEETIALILEAAGDGIFGLDAEGRTTFINPAAARMLGWEPEELIGESQTDFIHNTRRNGTPYACEMCPIDAAFQIACEACPIYTTFQYGKSHDSADEVFWRKDGTSFPVAYISRPILREGELVGAVVTFSDLTVRRALEAQIALVEDRERRALAEDLHDDVGQLHSLLSMKCRALRELVLDTALIGPIREIEDLARKAGERITSLSFELSPPLLHDVGPVAAAEWLAEHMKLQYGLSVELVTDGELNDIDESARVVLFRALRELLINVAKHAGTKQARVEMVRGADAVAVTVEDDGVGFDPNASRSRFGLMNLRGRVEQLGGSLVIDSAAGRGTTVSVALPWRSAGAR